MSAMEANRIRDTYDSSDRYIGPSQPLTPKILASLKDKLKPEQYRWLYISVWFGLRPREVDKLKSKKQGCVISNQIIEGEQIEVLSIYQTKLVSVSSAQRWKYIPIIFDEQKIGLDYLKLDLKRPLNKTLKYLTNQQITCYGGRKGFVDLMQNRGEKLEDISSWLGHNSIETTWKKYRNKKRVSYTRAKKSA